MVQFTVITSDMQYFQVSADHSSQAISRFLESHTGYTIDDIISCTSGYEIIPA